MLILDLALSCFVTRNDIMHMLPFKKFLDNPITFFVSSILNKWSLIVSTAALIVTFWVFKGLDEAGVIDAATNVLKTSLNETKSIAKYCTPKITNIQKFWECLENLPKYTPSSVIEKKLEQKLQQQKQPTSSSSGTKKPFILNPYDIDLFDDDDDYDY